MKNHRSLFQKAAASFAILLLSVSSWAIEPTKNPPAEAGTPVATNATMNDHDKKVESCNGVHGKAACDDMMKTCGAQKDKNKCMQMHFQGKKHK